MCVCIFYYQISIKKIYKEVNCLVVVDVIKLFSNNSFQISDAHPHKTGETEDDCGYPSTIDVGYRFFDPGRDNDLVRWHANLRRNYLF